MQRRRRCDYGGQWVLTEGLTQGADSAGRRTAPAHRDARQPCALGAMPFPDRLDRPRTRSTGGRRSNLAPSVPVRAGSRRGAQGPRRPPGRAGRQAAGRRGVGHRAGRRRRRTGTHRQTAGRHRHAARRAVHARRWLGAGQRRHPRPPGAGTGGRRTCGRGLRGVHAVPRSPLPGGHRAGLRRRPVDRPRRSVQGARRTAHGGGRGIGRREHDGRSRPHGQGAR